MMEPKDIIGGGGVSQGEKVWEIKGKTTLLKNTISLNSDLLLWYDTTSWKRSFLREIGSKTTMESVSKGLIFPKK